MSTRHVVHPRCLLATTLLLVYAHHARAELAELGPYYDPDFPPLVPHPNIEPGAMR